MTRTLDRSWHAEVFYAGQLFCCAVAIVLVAYTFLFRTIHPEFADSMSRNAEQTTVLGKDLIPISVGSARQVKNSLVVEQFNGDEVVVLVPLGAFNAEDFPFIKLDISGFTRFTKAKIIWRQESKLSQSHALEFNRNGDEATQLAMVYGHDNYKGKIADLLLLFYDSAALGFENNNDLPIIINSVELRPFSPTNVAEQIFSDWTSPPLWGGHSSNIVTGTHRKGVVFPNLAISAVIITSVFLEALMLLGSRLKITRPRDRNFLVTALILCLYGWAANDALRWQWRIEQAADTYARYAGRPLEERIINSDIRCARWFPKECGAHLLPYF